MAARVAVIGGGIAGLVAARRLVEAGVDATVFEASPRAGGVLGTTRDRGFLCEHAANAVLAATDGVLDLADELGVAMQPAAKAARRRFIWIDGARKPLPSGPIALARSDLLTWRGKLALLGEPFRAARDVEHAGDESVYAFAVRRLGPEAARAVIAPFVTGVYAADAHDVGLAAGFPRFAELDARGGLVRGMIARMVRGGRAATGGAKPARRRRGLFAPTDGMQAIVDALAAALGGRVQVGAPLASITPVGGGVELGFAAISTGTGGSAPARASERFDGAVLAVPAATTARLVATSLPALAAKLDGFVRAPAALVYLGYPRAAVPADADGFGLLVAQGEALRALGIVMESVVWSARAPDGTVLLRCVFGGARDPDACALDDTALAAQAQADVARALGVTGAPSYVRVHRAPGAIAQMPVGHRDRLAAVDALARAAHLVLGGAGFHGVALNDLVADARRIVDEVRAWA